MECATFASPEKSNTSQKCEVAARDRHSFDFRTSTPCTFLASDELQESCAQLNSTKNGLAMANLPFDARLTRWKGAIVSL